MTSKIIYFVKYEFGKSKIKKTFEEDNPLEARSKVAHYIDHLKKLYKLGYNIGLFKEQYENLKDILDIEVFFKAAKTRKEFLICNSFFPEIDFSTQSSDKDLLYGIYNNNGKKWKMHFSNVDPLLYNLEIEFFLYKEFNYDTGGDPIKVGVNGGTGDLFSIINTKSMNNLLMIIPEYDYPNVSINGINKGKKKFLTFITYKELLLKASFPKSSKPQRFIALSISPYGVSGKLERINIANAPFGYRYRVMQDFIYPCFINPFEEFTV